MKQFGIPYFYSNELELIKKLIDVYLVLKPIEENLYERAREALAFYILYGYNPETVEAVETGLGTEIKGSYVRSINSTLRKYKFLIKDSKNKHKSHLSPEMQGIRDHFVKGKGKTFTIGFIKNR